MPEATGNCYLEVDPTNADALILLDGNYHTYLSRNGGQTWQPVPNPPHWTPNQPFGSFRRFRSWRDGSMSKATGQTI